MSKSFYSLAIINIRTNISVLSDYDLNTNIFVINGRVLIPKNISQQNKPKNFAILELKKMAKFIKHICYVELRMFLQYSAIFSIYLFPSPHRHHFPDSLTSQLWNLAVFILSLGICNNEEIRNVKDSLQICILGDREIKGKNIF